MNEINLEDFKRNLMNFVEDGLEELDERPLKSMTLEELFESSIETYKAATQVVGTAAKVYSNNVVAFPVKLTRQRRAFSKDHAVGITPYSNVIPMCSYIKDVTIVCHL